MTTSSLPMEERPVRMDPDLSREVEKLLKPYGGERLERAQKAVMGVYHSGATGSFHEIVDTYRAAVKEAVVA